MADFSELFPADDRDPPAPLDVEMMSGEIGVEIPSYAVESAENGLPPPDGPVDEVPSRITYIQYLKSPMITLLVGHGEDQALLTAHEALLTQSPWFAETCAKFSNEVAVGACPLSSTLGTNEPHRSAESTS